MTSPRQLARPEGAVFSRAGDRILTASWDKTARVWDLAGKQLAVLGGHEGPVKSAVFSAAGDRILTGCFDQTARMWIVRDEDVLKLADERIGQQELSVEGRRMYAELLEERKEPPR